MPYPKLMFEGIYKPVRLSKNKTVRTKLVKYKISGKKTKETRILKLHKCQVGSLVHFERPNLNDVAHLKSIIICNLLPLRA